MILPLLSRSFPRNFAGYVTSEGDENAIPQFFPQFCGVAEALTNPAGTRCTRHFSRQNGERKGPTARKSGYPAILRDRVSSPDLVRNQAILPFFLPIWQEDRAIRTSCPDSANPEILDTARRDSAFQTTEGKPQSVPEGQDKLDVIEAEAKEADKALRKILKQLGV